FAVRYPEPNNDGKIRALTLVRVETDDGLVGWGEAITGGQEASLAVAFVVERRLAPIILGGDPRDVASLWIRLRDATYWDGNGGLGAVWIPTPGLPSCATIRKHAHTPPLSPPR